MLYDINSINSVRKLVANIPAKYLNFIVQNNGTPRFAYGVDDNYNAILYRLDDGSGEWRRVTGKQLGGTFRPVAFTPDDKAFYALYSETGGPTQIVREDLASGQRSVVASDPLGNIDLIEYTAEPKVPFALGTDVGIPKVRYLDEAVPDAALHKTLSGLFPDAFVDFINFTDDGGKLLFSVASDRDPGSYYLFDRASSEAKLLLTNMPQIDPADMGARKPVVFTALDGVRITGYLTLPKDAAGRKLPMVVMPHGGPFEIHDEWYFDPDAQFLASRALTKAGHAPEWMEVPNEGHGFYDSEHRKQFYLRLEAFLDKYIGK